MSHAYGCLLDPKMVFSFQDLDLQMVVSHLKCCKKPNQVAIPE